MTPPRPTEEEKIAAIAADYARVSAVAIDALGPDGPRLVLEALERTRECIEAIVARAATPPRPAPRNAIH